jgi:hypothetical protein
MAIQLKTITFLVLAALAAVAQAPTHSVTLTWVDSLNPAGTTYSVHRSAGMCSGTPVFSKISTALAVKTFEDTTVTPGNYCYTVTATFQGMESANSPTAAASVPSFPPSALSVVVK